MIKDYKSNCESRDISDHRTHPRLALVSLIGLGLCATAIYASLEALDTIKPSTAVTASPINSKTQTTKIPKTIALSLPAPKRGSTISQNETEKPESEHSLTLPAQSTTEVLAQEPQTDTENPTLGEEVITEEGAEIALQPEATPPSQPIGHWIEEKVKSGDSLAKIFSRLKLSPSLLHKIVNSSKEAKGLAKIRPGEILKVRLDEENKLLELALVHSPIKQLQILPEGDNYKTQTIERELEVRIANASGTIEESLYQGAQRAGLSDALIMELANIFGWDIDFALEIRSGDHFNLVYEEEYLDGKKFRNGAILAAEFVNRGKSFKAVRYEDDTGYASYFSPDGKSMRKAFLRAPVDFRRISSRFRKSRYHPVLGKKRPHRGVDYAAAPGTPIKAAGDGKIVFRGRKGGYGRTVVIQHGSQYRTLYAHMSRYNGKAKNGSRVHQGQVIGYVGSSGLATGPHLHYEFRLNGVHRNPLTVKLPAAKPIAKKYKADFQQKSMPLLAKLALVSKTMIAEAKQAQQ